ncbi:FecR domain-containing protein [bacterium]|nr:FecR domain-containing protein [bacterium]
MKIRSLIGLTLGSLIILSSFSSQTFAEDPPKQPAAAADFKSMNGKLTKVEGTVEVQKAGSGAWTDAKAGMEIGPGDQVAAGIDGKATLAFANSTTDVAPLAQFALGRAAESDKVYQTEIYLQVGKLVSKIDKASGKANRFTVTTPTSVAGIRGTTLSTEYTPGVGASNVITEGAGFVAPVQADKLPPAVQQMLNVEPPPAAREAAAKAAEKAGAPAAIVAQIAAGMPPTTEARQIMAQVATAAGASAGAIEAISQGFAPVQAMAQMFEAAANAGFSVGDLAAPPVGPGVPAFGAPPPGGPMPGAPGGPEGMMPGGPMPGMPGMPGAPGGPEGMMPGGPMPGMPGMPGAPGGPEGMMPGGPMPGMPGMPGAPGGPEGMMPGGPMPGMPGGPMDPGMFGGPMTFGFGGPMDPGMFGGPMDPGMFGGPMDPGMFGGPMDPGMFGGPEGFGGAFGPVMELGMGDGAFFQPGFEGGPGAFGPGDFGGFFGPAIGPFFGPAFDPALAFGDPAGFFGAGYFDPTLGPVFATYDPYYQLPVTGSTGDFDGDHIPDQWELDHGLDPKNPNDALLHFDNDGYNNLEEYLAGTDPRDAASFPSGPPPGGDNVDDPASGPSGLGGFPDADGDGMPDAWESQHGLITGSFTGPNEDFDNDGQTNLYEFQHGSDPKKSSSTASGTGHGDIVTIDYLVSDIVGGVMVNFGVKRDQYSDGHRVYYNPDRAGDMQPYSGMIYQTSDGATGLFGYVNVGGSNSTSAPDYGTGEGQYTTIVDADGDGHSPLAAFNGTAFYDSNDGDYNAPGEQTPGANPNNRTSWQGNPNPFHH